MRKDRLLKLAHLLEKDANDPTGVTFNLRKWGTTTDDSFDTVAYHKFLENIQGHTVPVSCGTTACAMGLAAISGIFAEDGLSYKRFMNEQIIPTFGGWEGFGAAEVLFEIDENTAYSLFDPAWYPMRTVSGKDAELTVARKVRYLIENDTLKGFEH